MAHRPRVTPAAGSLLMIEIRHAIRALRRTPFTTLSALLVLALGCGAATTMFALLDAALLAPLPYRDAGRIVALFRVERGGAEPRNPAPPADYFDWREADVFETVAAARAWTPTLTGTGEPARIRGILATPELFDLLGVTPLLGRASGNGVVLSHALWQQRFGGDRAVIGRAIRLDGEARRVDAVMPPGFRFPPFWASNAELWAPLELTPAQAADRGASYLRVFARLRDGVTVDRAQAAMTALGGRLAATYPRTNGDVGVNVEPLREPTVAGSRRMLVLIGFAVLLLVLLTCANVANVLLARALARRRDVAVRVALGAGRRDLVRQGLAESLVLAGAGGALGVLLARWCLGALAAFGPSGLMPAGPATVDLRVAAFAVLLAGATAAMVGLLPALRMGTTPAMAALHSRGTTRGDARIRDALVVSEVALASVLVGVATSTASALAALVERDPGFDREVVASVVGLSGPRYAEGAAQLRLIDAVRNRLTAAPGVQAVAAVNHVPVAGDLWRAAIDVEGGSDPAAAELSAAWRVIGGDWFGAMGIPLVRGRPFGEVTPEGPGVAIVNEAFARRIFGEDDPIGRRIRFGAGEGAGRWLEIVGVSANAVQSGIDEAPLPEVLLPYAQNTAPWFREVGFVIRVDARGAEDLATLVANAVHDTDATLPVESPRRLGDVLAGTLSDRTFAARALAASGTVALLLAAVGLSAILLQMVRRRTHEIAVRVALGASRANVSRLVVAHGLRLVALGLALGLVPAGLGVLLAGRFLPGTVPWPQVLASMVAALAGAGLAASIGPARLAARTAPFRVLRDG